MTKLGDYVPYDRQMCRVVGVTYRDGGIYRLARKDGTIIEDVPADRLRRPALKEIAS